jgi:hypothetical protein
MALNGITNVRCRPEALGAAAGTIRVPPVDYNQENNISGLALGGENGEVVNVATIDGLNLPKCGFIKVDVEGMELEVLKGAAKTIEKLRPVLYVDNHRMEKSPALITYLQSLDYALYWHVAPLYDPANFYQNATNEFGGAVSASLLGVHKSVSSEIAGLRKVEGPDSDWRKR